MKISQSELNTWLQIRDKELEEFYKENPARKPKRYSNNTEAKIALRQKKIQLENKMRNDLGKKPGTPITLPIGEVAVAIMETMSVVIMDVGDKQEMAIYDYDRKIYTYDLTTILNDCVVILMGHSSQKILNDVSLTMLGLRDYALVENPLPKYKVAVGNGIYNCITGELEPFDPFYTVLTRIDTNYIENPKQPQYSDGFTLEQMIDDFANGNEARIQLIKQIVKSIILGHSVKDVIFIIIGEGGDGKSTFFTMVSNILGFRNVSYVDFSQINNPEIMLTTLNKKLAIGMDNDDNVYVQKTARIKQIASKEPMSYTRKYQGAIAAPFLASFVQLVNTFPSFAGGGHAIQRRLVTFNVEKSHTVNGTANPRIESVYIKDDRFLEYALWYFLTEEKTPYYNGYNNVDDDVSGESLYSDDIVGQYIDTLYEIGVISNTNNYLPNTHLYKGYEDFVKQNSPSSPVMSSRSFIKYVRPKLKKYGFEPVERIGNSSIIRPKSLETTGDYVISSWDYFSELPNLSSAIELNQTSRMFKRVRDIEPTKSNSDVVFRVNPIVYFGIEEEIKRDLDLPPSERLVVEGMYNSDTKQINEVTEQSVEQEPQSEEDKLLSVSEIDVIEISKMLMKYSNTSDNKKAKKLKNKVIDGFREYQAWFDKICKNKDVHVDKFNIAMEREKERWHKAAQLLKDMVIIRGLENSVRDNDEIVSNAIDKFQEIYVENILGE